MKKSFDISFTVANNTQILRHLSVGEALFVLGPNGAGKSSLMLHFDTNNGHDTRRISAHRQTWMNTDALDMTSESKLQTERYMRKADNKKQSRWRDDYASQRASMAIYELIDAEHSNDRKIAEFVRSRNLDSAIKFANGGSPIRAISDLLIRSNLPIKLRLHTNDRLMASKNGSAEYSAAELSDGERNAILLAGNVLTVASNTLLLIDEPERHLHRSIISPLLSGLFERRPDCAFVISTHDPDLPSAMPKSRILLLRACQFENATVVSWEADELPTGTPIDDQLKRDLLGSRRNIVFVEGTESSLDRALYSLVFPMASVIPKGSRREVERAVSGVQAGESFHWLRAFGIVDGDGYNSDEHQASRERRVYAMPYYAVESIYFHPWIIKRIAERQAGVTGDAASDLTHQALSVGVSAIRDQTERLSKSASKKLIRRHIYEKIPNDDDLLGKEEVHLETRSKSILAARKNKLDDAVRRNDWETLVTKCPVRNSRALKEISRTLSFQSIEKYEQSVRHLLTTDNDAMCFVRKLFYDLFDRLNMPHNISEYTSEE